MSKTAILYARVSTDEQARSGYSLRQQLEALRAYAEREGYEVLEEVQDPAESGASLERPGLDRVRDLVEAGGVSMVLAQDADRISRDPVHRALLDEEMERSGARLVALDDWGDDTHEGQLLRYMKGWVSKGERLKIAERTRRGKARKIAEGKVMRGPKAPYGFHYSGDSLAVTEPEMEVVRLLFRMVGAEGLTLGEVQRRLGDKSIPAPTGGRWWQKPSLRHILRGDLYRPHTTEEIAGCVLPEVAGALDPEEVYGLWGWNKRRQTEYRERDGEGGYRTRYEKIYRPPEEWLLVPVPITAAGLSRELVDAARERLSENTRRPLSTANNRVWQLSGGLLKCAVCGGTLSPKSVLRRSGSYSYYYRCVKPYRRGPSSCTNRRNMRAGELEEAVWEAVYGTIAHPEQLLRSYKEHLKRNKSQMRGDPDQEALSLHRQLEELEDERRGYLRQNARGVLPDAELDSMLAVVDAQRRGLQDALREAQRRKEALRKPRLQHDHLNSILLQLNGMDLGMASMEDRRRIYGALRLKVTVDEDRTVRMGGVFNPDLYLMDILNDPPDWLTPRPDGSGVVVTSDNTSRAIS